MKYEINILVDTLSDGYERMRAYMRRFLNSSQINETP
jgi:hypothetical protein